MAAPACIGWWIGSPVLTGAGLVGMLVAVLGVYGVARQEELRRERGEGERAGGSAGGGKKT